MQIIASVALIFCYVWLFSISSSPTLYPSPQGKYSVYTYSAFRSGAQYFYPVHYGFIYLKREEMFAEHGTYQVRDSLVWRDEHIVEFTRYLASVGMTEVWQYDFLKKEYKQIS
jgi:hypothetical protein